MKISEYAINELKCLVSGDCGSTTRKTGPQLISFFNSYGERDIYDKLGINDADCNDEKRPSRNEYSKNKLTKFNNTKKIKDVLENIINYHSENKEETVKFIENLINRDNYSISSVDNKYFINSEEYYEENIVKEVHFEDIQEKIISQLDAAKYTIWVAIAWFTDEKILKKLIEKKNQGVNVQVIIGNDEINTNYGFQLEKYFETHRIDKTRYDNIMHNKFCIIDLETVINGSYNWTKKAQYNQENISIDKSRILAEQYADQFIKLKQSK